MKMMILVLATSTVLGLLPMAAVSQEGGAKWLTVQPTEQSAVAPSGAYLSFTFDDATSSQFEVAFPVLQAAGIPATLYVGTAALDRLDPFFMNWDQVREVAAKGWEIGGHTVTHQSLITLTEAQVRAELAFSNQRLATEVGVVPVSFASPYGDYNEELLVHIDSLYENHVRAWGDYGGVNPSFVDPLLIERINIDQSLTIAQVCSMVANVKRGQWLVLMFHQVADVPAPWFTTKEQLQGIATCVAAAARRDELTVGTVSDVIKHLKEE